MAGLIKRAHDVLLDLFFPRRCVVCGADGLWCCQICESKAMADHVPEVMPLKGGLGIVSLFDFGKPMVRERLHYLKYNGIREGASDLVSLARRMLGDEWLAQTFGKGEALLVPIPTTKAKIKVRGYNQAEEVAGALAAWFDVPVLTDVLVRAGKNASQVGKSAGSRRINTLTAFELVLEKMPVEAEKKTWILVDDVCTTGSTITACAKLLQERGLRVGAIVMAHKQGAILM